MDTSACDEQPAPRIAAQAAGFTLDEPIRVHERSLSRGVVLYGGRSSAGVLLSDLWVFDLALAAAPDPEQCPWLRVRAAPSRTDAVALGPLASGGMVFSPERESVLLAGGFAPSPGGEATVNAAWELNLRAMEAGWVAAGVIEDDALDFTVKGAPACAEVQLVMCQSVNERIEPTQDAECDNLGDGHVGHFVCEDHDVVPTPEFTDPELTTGLSRCDARAQAEPSDSLVLPLGQFTGCGKRRGLATRYPGCALDPHCASDNAPPLHAPVRTAGRGRAEHAVVWADGALAALGGTTGCTGAACGAWATIFDADLVGAPRLRAANLPFASHLGSPSTSAGEVAAPTSEWPAGASHGWRAGVAVPIGATWSPEDRSWTHQGNFLLLGGTRQQEVAPGVEHELECEVAPPACFAPTCVVPAQLLSSALRCTSFASAGFGPIDAPGNSGSGALVPMVRSWTSGTNAVDVPPASGAGLSGRVGAAAVALPDGVRVLLIGGARSNGGRFSSPTLLRIDEAAAGLRYAVEAMAFEGDAEFGPREGATAVLDPVSGGTWIFGGHATDHRALWLVPPDVPPPTEIALQISDVKLEFSVEGDEPSGANWTVNQWATLDVDCEEADCWSQHLDLVVLRPREATTSLPRLTVHWEGIPSSTSSEVAPALVAQDPAQPKDLLRYGLPRELVHGDRLRVQMQWEGVAFEHNTVYLASEEVGLHQAPFADDGSRAVAWSGVLFTPVGPDDDWDGPRLDDVSTIVAAVPEGWTAIAAGISDHTGPAVSPDTVARIQAALQVAPAELRVWWVENLLPPVRRDEAGIPVYFYPHQRLVSATPAVMSFLQNDVGDDLLWLRQRFGPLARAPGPGVLPLNGMSVLVRPPSGGGEVGEEDEVGVTYVGLIDVHQGRPDGRVDVPTLRSTTLHELAHAHLDLNCANSASWFQEGATTLTEIVRFPEIGRRSRLLEAVVQEVNRRGALRRMSGPSLATSETLRAREDVFRRYNVGAYTLAQWSALRGGPPHTEPAIWRLMRDARAQHRFQATLGADDVASLLDAGEPGFSAAWTASDRPGLPLLGITALEHLADGRVRMRVEQVQTALLGVPPFAAVPVHLACHPSNAQDTVAWSGCTAHGDGLVAERRRVTAPSFEVIIPSHALTLPAQFALFQGPSLLPEHEGTYGVIPPGMDPFKPGLIPPPLAGEPTPAWPPPVATWLTRCRPDQVGVHAACLTDSDGDRYPPSGDCDDQSARRRPDQPDAGEAWLDLNCDGWYAFPGAP